MSPRGSTRLYRSRAHSQFQFGRGVVLPWWVKKLARRAGTSDRMLRTRHAPEPFDPLMKGKRTGVAYAHSFSLCEQSRHGIGNERDQLDFEQPPRMSAVGLKRT